MCEGVHPCNFHTETGLRVLCRRTRCMCTRARASSLPRYACVCFIRTYVRVIHRKTHARKIMHLHRIVCNDVSMCTCVWSSVVCGYMRIHVNAHTVTHGLAISHVGKCVKDVRTGLQNVSSRFVDETISLSLSLSLSLGFPYSICFVFFLVTENEILLQNVGRKNEDAKRRTRG